MSSAVPRLGLRALSVTLYCIVLTLLLASKTNAASNTTLDTLCTVANIRASLPTNGTLLGIHLLPDSVTAQQANASSAKGGAAPGATSTSSSASTVSYCNVTLDYVHAGAESNVIRLVVALPSPSEYKNRFYVGGGGGYSLSSDATGGLTYGAASAVTDAGYDAFSNSLDEVVLRANGTLNWNAVRMFSYQALGEMTMIVKQILPSLYGETDTSKVYTYFSGCSDGGREAMSQVQRWGQLYDGVVAGAPAFRQSQQQVLHVYSAAIEQQLDYFPPPCALQRIVNATIEACDPLDGRSDGVVSRTDLCMLNYNVSSTVGLSYYCAAQSSTSLGYGFSRRQMSAGGSSTTSQPEQKGNVTQQDAEVARQVYRGLFTSSHKRAYLSWQIGSSLGDAEPTYDNTTSSWTLNIPSTGGVFVRKFLQRLDLDNLDAASFANVTNDKLAQWMDQGTREYLDTLQTNWPDLSDFANSGGKLIHYHGESDPSIPAASSVYYRNSVATTMHPKLTESKREEKLDAWYRFFLVPGGAHCGSNSLQPNGPFPEDESLMSQIIDWVENDTAPAHLNATVTTQSSSDEGQSVNVCRWPTRPTWSSSNSSLTSVKCEQPETRARNTWKYDFDAFGYAIY
ncbi:related to tannase precursor [Melanopsichium pennsylvanicum]|uniref:Carboxylic ester hydrolase n=2 Tax=Melanopsichium pennsylvanicum TaxID=63383 RepID=A0AAJ4XUA8_9BASI|nr:uncharacterized protein BN887_03440 [Melanopsichium pennsylvanicum 4]SNX87728.1 related to tannase precursor [Melanopsichium pennsylvanicum]